MLNNRVINPILRTFKLDGKLNDFSQDYLSFKPDNSKSLIEIAGYSHHDKVTVALQNTEKKLIEVAISLPQEHPKILDIGCGPGRFLKIMPANALITGIDINEGMCQIASQQLPHAKIIHGHFLKGTMEDKYNLIYSVGVLIYFSHSQVKDFFDKIYSLMENQGLAFISYPHAFRKKDLTYHDYTYVHYSPEFLEKMVSGKFSIIYHKHQNGSTSVKDYDHNPFIIEGSFDNRNYYNSSILILKKR